MRAPFQIFACLQFLVTSAPVAAKTSLTDFYDRAFELSQDPTERKLTVVCSHHDSSGHVTFVGTGKDTALIVTFTPRKLRSPSKDLWLKVSWVARSEPGHLISATQGPTRDWAYVYDRDRDGKVDYMVYAMGPMPFEPDDFPPDFPKRDSALTVEQFKYMVILQMKYVFFHVADDDGDGAVDGFVIHNLDPDRDWVMDWLAIRASGTPAKIDTAWHFRGRIGEKKAEAVRADGGLRWNSGDRPGDTWRPVLLEGWSRVLARVNDAARSCSLDRGHLAAEP